MSDLPPPLTPAQDEMCAELLDKTHMLSDWEIDFVESIIESEWKLTDEQATCLLKLYEEKL